MDTFCHLVFFFNHPPTTEIYTLSLHDALPIYQNGRCDSKSRRYKHGRETIRQHMPENHAEVRSEEHTSELQSHSDLVCRLLLEKKKKKQRSEYRLYETI